MPLMGSSRSLGLKTRMRTWSRCEKKSPLCTFRSTTDSFGASNFGKTAQLDSHANSGRATRPSRPPRSGSRIRQHVRRDQNHALLGDQETLGVFSAVVTDAGPRRQLAVLVDDGVAYLAVGTNAHVGQHH